MSAILPYFFTFGGNDYARDPEVKKLVTEAGRSPIPTSGAKSTATPIKLITERAEWLPMFTYVKTYGFSRQLNFKPYPGSSCRGSI